MIKRRFLLAGAALLPLAPARATPGEVATLIRELTGGAPITPGLVKLDLPLLVENGNTVAMTVGVEGLPPGVACESLHVFAPENPAPRVISLRFGPAAARPQLATRIRLATSQTVTAIAKLSDGSFRSNEIELLVTLAACLDE